MRTNCYNIVKWSSYRNSAVSSVKQELIFAGSEHGKIIGLKTLFQNSFELPALIFVQVFSFSISLFSRICLVRWRYLVSITHLHFSILIQMEFELSGQLVILGTMLHRSFLHCLMSLLYDSKIFWQSKLRAKQLVQVMESLQPPIPVKLISSEKTETEVYSVFNFKFCLRYNSVAAHLLSIIAVLQ